MILHLDLMPFLYSFIYALIHSCFLRAYYMPVTTLGPGDTEVSHSDSNIYFNGAYILVEKKDKAQTRKIYRMAWPHPTMFPSIIAVVSVLNYSLIDFYLPYQGISWGLSPKKAETESNLLATVP